MALSPPLHGPRAHGPSGQKRGPPWRGSPFTHAGGRPVKATSPALSLALREGRRESGRLRDVGDGRENRGGRDGHVRQHLAVQADLRLRQAGDQLRVRQADRASRRVDADDPQAAEVPLALHAVAAGVVQGALNRLVRPTEAVLPAATETLGKLQDLVATATSLYTLLDAHVSLTPDCVGCQPPRGAGFTPLRQGPRGCRAEAQAP